MLTDFIQSTANRIVIGKLGAVAGLIITTVAGLIGGAVPAYQVKAPSGGNVWMVTNKGAIGVGTGASMFGSNGDCLKSGGGSGVQMTFGTCGSGGGGGRISGTGAQNYVATFNAATVLSGSSLFQYYPAQKQLTLGTATPKAALTVIGSGAFTGSLSGSTLKIMSGATIRNGNFNVDNNLFWDSVNNKLGVGTTTPTTALEVVSDGGTEIRARSTETTSYGRITNANNAGELAAFNMYGQTFGGTVAGVSRNSLGLWFTTGAGGMMLNSAQDGNNHPIYFAPNNISPAMTINAVSQVGIRTTTPKAALHVIGSGAFTGTLSGSTVFAQNQFVAPANTNVTPTYSFNGLPTTGFLAPTNSPIVDVVIGGTAQARFQSNLTRFTGDLGFGGSAGSENVILNSPTLNVIKIKQSGQTGIGDLWLRTLSGLVVTVNGAVTKAPLTVRGSGAFTGTLSGAGLVIQGGLSTPRGKLEVFGTMSGQELKVNGSGLTIAGHKFIYPSAQGGASTCLSNNGSDTLSWGACSGGAGSSRFTGTGGLNYIMYGTTATNLSGSTALQWLNAAKQMSIGTSTFRSTLYVAGSGAFTKSLSGNTLLIQSGGYVIGNFAVGSSNNAKTKLAVTGTVSGSALTIMKGATTSYFLGNVGIGSTSAPSNPLTVTGNMNITSKLGIQVTAPTADIDVTDLLAIGNVGIRYRGVNSWNQQGGGNGADAGRALVIVGTIGMILNNSGSTAGWGGGSIIKGGSGGSTLPSNGTSFAGSGGNLEFVGGAGGNSKAGTGGRGGNIYIIGGRAGTGTVATGISGSVLLAIDANKKVIGNVGVGLLLPHAKLDVLGTISGSLLSISSGATINAPTGNILTIQSKNVSKSFFTQSGTLSVNNTGPYRSALNVFGVMSGSQLTVSGVPAEGSSQNALCITAAGVVQENNTTTCLVSSLRFKHDVLSMKDIGLQEVNALRPVNYKDNSTGVAEMGLIAEEVAKIEPTLVFYENDGKTVRGVKYENLTALLVKAQQEEDDKVNALQDEINNIQAQLLSLSKTK